VTGLLRRRAERQPDQTAFTFLLDGDARAASLTYAELDRRARAIAVALRQRVHAGDRALVAYESSLEFIAAFFGCLYAGVIAVPVAPPGRRGTHRFRAVAEACGAAVALSHGERRSRAGSAPADSPGAPPTLDITACDMSLAAEWRPPAATREKTAFLQFTSGSTAQPRGVVLTHDNLLHNQAAIRDEFRTTRESSVFGWLPLHHDMGLIGTVLHPIFMGIPCVLMSPAHFIERPIRWLRALSHYRSTISGGPNFAFDLCVRRTSIEERASLDLSAWTVAFNGAEPVRPQTLRSFASAFSAAGFRNEAFHPCYGLAEATLLVAGGAQDPAPVTARFDRALLASNVARPAEGGDEHTRELIAYQPGTAAQHLHIVRSDETRRCSPGEVGEIWVAGPGIARGYWDQPEDTAQTFGARIADIGDVIREQCPFLRTGDLGFFHEGHLFIAGRLKDLIILRGRNLHPEDIERSVEASHPMLRPGAGVAFSHEVDGVERLVVVHEVERRYRSDGGDAVARVVRQAVADQHDAHVDTLVLVTTGEIPKTTSGKVQRGVCKARYLEGTLNEVARITGPALDSVEGPSSRDDLLSLPDNDRRARVIAIVRQTVAPVLGIPDALVDVSVPPATLGLDSLMAVEWQHRLERSLGIQMSGEALLRQSSLTAVGDYACDLLASRGPDIMAGAPADTAFALSEGQRAWWLMDQLGGGGSPGRLSRSMAVRGPLDVPAFINALRRLVNRHAALRTTVGSREGEPRQSVQDEDHADVTFTDASEWSPQALLDRVQQEVSRPMTLEGGPLFRASLLRQSDQEHVLVLTVHHAIADFWSVAVILNDLEEYYAADRAGRSDRLLPLDASYADYVSREQQLLHGEKIEPLWDYWRQQLHGAPLVLDLHGDRVRPPVRTFRGATCWFDVEPSVLRQLKALAKTHGVTLFAVLLAAYQALLHRHTGHTDLLVGVPVANRRDAAWRGLVGYFVNLVVMRGDLGGNPTFATLLDRTKSTLAGALAHQDLPFPTLVERLRPERDFSRPPVVQCSMVVLSDHGFNRPGIAALAAGARDAPVRLDDLSLSPFGVESLASEFDLSLTLAETGERLTGRFDYNSDLFDAETVRLLTTRWQTLLTAVAARPADPVGLVPVITESERQRILEAGRGDRRAVRDHATHRIFEAQVPHAADAVVADEASECTFQQLNARANQLARALRRLGVGAETRVALCTGRSTAMLVSALAVLKAGGAYVPLDPSHPPARLAWILEDAHASVLVADRAAEGLFPSYRGRLLWLDREADAIAEEDPGNLTHDTDPEQAAYVLYTSGSTGVPNGVLVPHHALSNLLGSMQRRPGLTRTDRLLSVTTLAFDIAGLELFLPLITGASLMIASQETVADAARLAARIASYDATVMQATPATWRMLVEAGWTGKGDMTVLCGGEALSVELAAQLVSGCAAVWNMYGPTETTIWSTTGLVRAGEGGIGLGRPIENTDVHVLDSQRQPVPIGVSGELYIGGDGLARGYLGRPDLTAERFVPHPFSVEPGRRLYRTGDRVRLRADGALDYLGRADHQIKLRGFRIDPSEIERAVAAHPLVHQAVVVAHEDRRGDTTLVAYVVGDPSSEASLRDRLTATLPGYMVPSAIVFLSALPLTPNGKVDRRALPAPAAAAAGAPPRSRAPADGLERTIADSWCEVLNIDRVGAADNFFDVGGHSLLLNRVRAQLERRLAREIPMLELFRHPTVATLARYLGDSSLAAAGGPPEGRTEGSLRLRKSRERRQAARSPN
jgi:amino acid adenylation domain-containing protein